MLFEKCYQVFCRDLETMGANGWFTVLKMSTPFTLVTNDGFIVLKMLVGLIEEMRRRARKGHKENNRNPRDK